MHINAFKCIFMQDDVFLMYSVLRRLRYRSSRRSALAGLDSCSSCRTLGHCTAMESTSCTSGAGHSSLGALIASSGMRHPNATGTPTGRSSTSSRRMWRQSQLAGWLWWPYSWHLCASSGNGCSLLSTSRIALPGSWLGCNTSTSTTQSRRFEDECWTPHQSDWAHMYFHYGQGGCCCNRAHAHACRRMHTHAGACRRMHMH